MSMKACHPSSKTKRPTAQAACSEGVRRLSRPRLLYRGYAARTFGRSSADQVPPALLVDVSKRDLSTQHPRRARQNAADPGSGRPARHAAWRRGDLCLPRAQAAGHPFTQSTMSICSIEDSQLRSTSRSGFQLYVMKDRGFIKALIERAIAAKCSAWCSTVDLQVIGQRHQDIKNGMSVPPEWTLSKTFRFRHESPPGSPASCAASVALRQHRGPRQRHRGSDQAVGMDGLAVRHHAELLGHRLDPQHLAGQADLKGILDVEDAELRRKPARRRSWSSNHGGRQLERRAVLH